MVETKLCFNYAHYASWLQDIQKEIDIIIIAVTNYEGNLIITYVF